MPITINGSAGTITGVSTGGLPDGSVDADTLASNAVTTAKIADSAVTSAKSSGLGISVAKQFRMHTTYTLPTNSRVTVNDYWESIDTDTPGVLGSFADPSSGVFAFPSTGIWLIQWQAYFLAGTGTSSECFITTTTDNSSYDIAASARFEAHDGGDLSLIHI